MNRVIARAYIGGGVVVRAELEDEIYYVLVDVGAMYPLEHAKAIRERPALRMFNEVVDELRAQFETRGWRNW